MATTARRGGFCCAAINCSVTSYNSHGLSLFLRSLSIVSIRKRYKLLQRGAGRTPAAKRFSCLLGAPDGLSWNFLRAKFGGGEVMLPTLCKALLC